MRRLLAAARGHIGTAHRTFTQRASAVARRPPTAILHDVARSFAPLFSNASVAGARPAAMRAMPRLRPRAQQQPFGRFGSGSRPTMNARPHVGGSSTTTVGLGSARTFASGQPVLATVFGNTPLGIRLIALGFGGVDQRGGTKQRAAQLAHKVGGSSVGRVEQWRVRVAEAPMSETLFDVAASTSTVYTVRLVIPHQPSTMPTPSSSVVGDVDLLSSAALHDLRDLQQALTLHKNRVDNLSERLHAVGAFDGDYRLSVRIDRTGHVSVLELPAPWTVGDVRQALGLWPHDTPWFELIDLTTMEDDTSTEMMTEDEGVSWHDDVAGTLVLPTMSVDSVTSSPTMSDLDHASSLSVSPPLGSSYDRGIHDFLATIDAGRQTVRF